MPSVMPRQVALAKLLVGEYAFATTLLVILVDTYGTEAFSWAPETIAMELAEDFGVEIPRENLDKLFAAIGLVTSDDFFMRLPVFIQYCNVLSGDDFTPGEFNPANSAEMAWGITEALLISPPEGDEPFAEEIRWYIGKVLDDEGIKNPPDVLQLAVRDSPTYDLLDAQDPAEFKAYYDMQQERSKIVVEAIQSNLEELIQQLEHMPLENGDTADLVKRLAGSWHKNDQEQEQDFDI